MIDIDKFKKIIKKIAVDDKHTLRVMLLTKDYDFMSFTKIVSEIMTEKLHKKVTLYHDIAGEKIIYTATYKDDFDDLKVEVVLDKFNTINIDDKELTEKEIDELLKLTEWNDLN